MTEVKCFQCGILFINTSRDGEVIHFKGYSRIRSDYAMISLPMCVECISETWDGRKTKNE